MPIDASIALGVKPIQFESPINQMAKMYEMQNMQQSNQLNQMKMSDLQRASAKEEDLNALVGRFTPDMNDTDKYNALLRGGHFAEAKAFNESAAKANADKRAAESARLDNLTKVHGIFKTTMNGIIGNPTLANAINTVRKTGVLLGENTADDEAELMAFGENPTAIRQWATNHALEADKLLAKPTERATNTYKELTDTNPASSTYGQVIPGSRIEMGVSPNTTATINAAAEQGRLNREAKLKAEIDSGVTGLSPESLDFTAQLYVQTGMLPPLGMGAKAATLRKQIIERAAQLSMHPETAGAVNPAAPGATTPPVAPPVSAADAAGNVTQNKQNVAVAVKTLKDFSTGVQGQMVASFNTALNHLDTLERLGNELNNSDIKVVNRAANLFAKELGVAAPTSFDAAKKIVGAEIQKAIVRAGGTGSEREEAAAAFDAANSPAQLAGIFRSVRELLGGQLVTLKQQYDSNAGPKAKPFANKLNSAARKQLESLTGGKTSATSAPAPAAKTTLPLKNKQGWILHTDANGNKAYVSSDGQIKEVK